MGRYIYVQALVNKNDADYPGDAGLLSFRHTEVSASSEDSAYDAGHQWWKENPLPEYASSVANDYVIKVD